MGNYAKTYFTSISHPERGENFSETLSKIHVFITQTGKNHPEIGGRHAGKMIISSFVSTSVSALLKIDYE